MGRIALLLILVAIIGALVFYGGSYLVIYWRDTLRRWRLEREADEKRKLKEANEEFLKAAEHLNSIEAKVEKGSGPKER